MARDAGFSLVASLSQRTANDYIRVYFANNVSPQPIPLPASVSIAGTTVNLAGTVALLPPEVSFTQNAQNAVTLNAALMGTLQFSSSALPSQEFPIILYTTLTLPLATNRSGPLVFPGINFAPANVNSIGIEVLRNLKSPSANPLQPLYQQALTSGPVLAALTIALQAFQPTILPISPLQIPAVFNLPASRGAPYGTSEFGPFPTWFTLSFAPTRMVPLVLNGAVTVGVDVNGWTTGDTTQTRLT